MRAEFSSSTAISVASADNSVEPDIRPLPGIPHFLSEVDWHSLTGMSRATTYRCLGRGELRAVKIGRSMRIDAWHGMRWLESLPPAKIAAPKQRVA